MLLRRGPAHNGALGEIQQKERQERQSVDKLFPCTLRCQFQW